MIERRKGNIPGAHSESKAPKRKLCCLTGLWGIYIVEWKQIKYNNCKFNEFIVGKKILFGLDLPPDGCKDVEICCSLAKAVQLNYRFYNCLHCFIGSVDIYRFWRTFTYHSSCAPFPRRLTGGTVPPPKKTNFCKIDVYSQFLFFSSCFYIGGSARRIFD